MIARTIHEGETQMTTYEEKRAAWSRQWSAAAAEWSKALRGKSLDEVRAIVRANSGGAVASPRNKSEAIDILVAQQVGPEPRPIAPRRNR